MGYAVKELFRTLQGEGARAGRAAVFCRFSGCNLWSGRDEDRAEATCRFCDTDFVGTTGAGGGRFGDADTLALTLATVWGHGREHRYVVFTGGEPLLQLDAALIDACHAHGFEIAVESNGTLPAPAGIDWLTVSPKAGAPWVQRRGDELKLVWPQPGFDLAELETLPFAQFWLQPMDGPERVAHTHTALSVCLERPRWRLGLQMHKLIGIP